MLTPRKLKAFFVKALLDDAAAVDVKPDMI
jgi:hypothetical protein